MKISLIYIACSILFCQGAIAGKEEMRLRVLNPAGGFWNNVTVYLYQYSDFYSGRLTPIRSAATTSIDTSCNLRCDVGDDPTDLTDPSWAHIDDGDYILRIGNRYVLIMIDPPSGGAAGDFTIQYQSGSFAIIDNNRGIAFGAPGDWPDNQDVTFSASYGSGGHGYVDNFYIGLPHTENFKKGTTHTFTAINNESIGGHLATFRKWDGTLITNLGLTVSIDDTEEYQAFFGVLNTLNITNSFPEAVTSSNLVINGTLFTESNFSIPAYSDQATTVIAVDQTINNINMTFDHWSDGGSWGSSRPFSPQTDVSRTIYYHGVPTPVSNWTSTCNLWEPISMSWSDHPNTNVTQYQIWRKVGTDPASLLTTLNRGTTSFTDGEFLLTPPRVLSVQYDVRAYYAPSGTTSSPVWHLFYTNPLYKKVTDSAVPTEYVVRNFPNPFNPSTTITYQIVDEAEISLEIIDIAGRLVNGLLHENKSAGYYAASWNGRAASGESVASGVYFYVFRAKPINGNAIIVRTGKLLLTK